MLVRSIAGDALAPYQVKLSPDSSVRLNPFLAKLSVKNLTLTNRQSAESLYVESLSIQVNPFRLFAKQLYISEFILDGARISIAQKEGGFEVAGILLSDLPASNDTPVAESETENSDVGGDYTVVAKELSISGVYITSSLLPLRSEADAPPKPIGHIFSINSLQLNDISANAARQSLSLHLESLINEAPLELEVDVSLSSGAGNITSALSLKNFPLESLKTHRFQEGTVTSGKLNLKLQTHIELSAEGLAIGGDQLEIRGENISLAEHNRLFSSQALSLQSDKFGIELKQANGENTLSHLDLHAFAAIDGVSLNNTENQEILAQWKALKLNDIQLEINNNQPSITLDSITLSGLISSLITNEDPTPPLASCENISVAGISASAENLAIKEITIDGLNGDILLSKQKTLANLVDIDGFSTPNQTQAKDPQAPKKGDSTHSEIAENTTEENTSPFGITLENFSLINTKRIFFSDNSTTPPYQRTIYIDKFTSGPFYNLKPQTKSPFILEGRSDEYTHFAFKGDVSPFTKELNFTVNGSLKELSLPAVSTYMKDALGLDLKTGELDTDIDVSAVDSQLKGSTRFKVRGLEMSAANDMQADSIQDQTALPLNVALGMLKDKNGNIDLKIPVTGNANEPSFGVRNFVALIVKKAVMSQAKSYLMKTFVPYASVVSVAMAAGEFALKIRFNDLEYRPTSSQLEEEQRVFAQQFILLMKDKPKTQVKICGIATAADIGLSSNTTKLDGTQLEQLKHIAVERAKNFKDHAINTGQIKSSRMLLCAPEVDMDEKAAPRIKIST
ncbi:MAG: hypothetical protein ACI9Y1_000666 [Lentisphaeria bacterium]|jgi:hypothetical protein